MSFAYPFLLLLLVVPALLLYWGWKHQGQKVVLPFDFSKKRGNFFLRILVRSMQCLPYLILAAAVILLAGPRQLTGPKSKRVLTNIEFCLDVSGSMASQFGDGTRSDAAMKAINDFIDYREGDAFGLTIFGSNFLHWVPLTSDPSAFKCAGPFIRPEKLPGWFGGGTMLGMGLKESMKVLASREEGDRMIIVISDGYSFDLSGGNDQKLARELSDYNVQVFAIHTANSDAPQELYTIAQGTGGEVFTAGDPEALSAVFKRIDEMKVTRLEKTLPENMDDFFPVCVAGLSLLGLTSASLFGLRYTPW